MNYFQISPLTQATLRLNLKLTTITYKLQSTFTQQSTLISNRRISNMYYPNAYLG